MIRRKIKAIAVVLIRHIATLIVTLFRFFWQNIGKILFYLFGWGVGATEIYMLRGFSWQNGLLPLIGDVLLSAFLGLCSLIAFCFIAFAIFITCDKLASMLKPVINYMRGKFEALQWEIHIEEKKIAGKEAEEPAPKAGMLSLPEKADGALAITSESHGALSTPEKEDTNQEVEILGRRSRTTHII